VISEDRLDKLHRLLVTTDWPVAQIAREMKITLGTARFYTRHLFSREAATGRIQLMHREILKLRGALEGIE
jgi:DNA-binding NarL/FixJ family response regulator